MGMFWIFGLVGLVVFAAKIVPWRTHASHTTRVPVDDFVVGDLPEICVVTGEPAHGFVDFETDDSRFQWWMIILIFLGPVGWVLMALIYGLSHGPGRVGGVLPMTNGALESHNHVARISNRAWLVPIAGFMAGAIILSLATDRWGHMLGLALLILGLVGGFALLTVVAVLTATTRVSAELDATHRWIELRNVHPEFAAAVNRRVRDNHRARKSDRGS